VRIYGECYAVMAFGTDYPNWHSRCLKVLSNLEITEEFEKCQKANVGLFICAFQDEALTEVFLSIVHV